MKCSEIWHVYTYQQKKIQRINYFLSRPFLARKKEQKFTKNEEKWQNPNRLLKFSEI